MSRLRSIAAAPVVAIALAHASSAAAQGWLPDRVRADGEGFRTDSAEIHPSFAADAGYDGNVFLEELDPDRAAVLRLTAGVFIQPRRVEDSAEDEADADESRRMDFRLGLSTGYYHYFATGIRDNVSANLDANVRIHPERRVSVELGQNFNRTIRPFTDATASGGRISYGQNRSQTTFGLHFQSPGGVLRGSLSYTGDLTFFDSNLFSANNSFENRVQARMTWSFFPRTALVYEGNGSFLSYGVAGSGDPYARIVRSRRVGNWVGVNGILTPKLSLTLAAGYGAGFFAVGSEYDGYLARAELRYRPRASMTFTLGYGHDFQASYIGNYNDVTTGYLNTEMAFAGRFVLGTQTSIGYSQSGIAKRTDGSFIGNFQNRIDTRVLARLYGEYRATDYLAITLSMEYLGDFTDFRFANPTTGVGIIPDPGAAYSRFDLWLGARVYH